MWQPSEDLLLRLVLALAKEGGQLWDGFLFPGPATSTSSTLLKRLLALGWKPSTDDLLSTANRSWNPDYENCLTLLINAGALPTAEVFAAAAQRNVRESFLRFLLSKRCPTLSTAYRFGVPEDEEGSVDFARPLNVAEHYAMLRRLHVPLEPEFVFFALVQGAPHSVLNDLLDNQGVRSHLVLPISSALVSFPCRPSL